MYIKLCFDVHDRIVYVPDGYIVDLKKLQNDFLDWIHNNPDCIVTIGKHSGYRYAEDEFLTYINLFVLNGNEKAYFIDGEIKENTKLVKLYF